MGLNYFSTIAIMREIQSGGVGMENRDNVKEKEEKEVFVLELLSEIKEDRKSVV